MRTRQPRLVARMMWLIPVTAAAGWFAWTLITCPVIETDLERRLRADREVEVLDFAWDLPAFSEGIHR